MKNLFEIEESIREFLENGFDESCIDTETGEILEDVAEEKLNSLQYAFDNKVKNIGLFIKELKVKDQAYKDEIKRMQDRKKAINKKIDGMTKYIATALQLAKKKSFETPQIKMSFRKSNRVEINDISKIDKQFIREIVELKADKMAIKKAIVSSEQLMDGVDFIEDYKLQIK